MSEKNSTKNKQDNNAGVSLLEALIYISIMLIVLVVFSNFTVNIIRGSGRLVEAKEVHQSLRPIVNRISQEVKTARQIIAVSADEITLENALGQTVSYTCDAGAETIYRDDGTDVINLSDNGKKISACAFAELDNAIRIDLTLSSSRAFFGQASPYSASHSSYVVLRRNIY